MYILFKIIFRLFGYNYEEGNYYMLSEDIEVKDAYAYKSDKANEFQTFYLKGYPRPFYDRYYFLKLILKYKKQ